MTIDDLIKKLSPQEQEAFHEIVDAAGTYDAAWSVLESAAKLLAAERNKKGKS